MSCWRAVRERVVSGFSKNLNLFFNVFFSFEDQSIIRIKPTNYTNYPSPPSAVRTKPTKVPMVEVLEPIVSETSHKSRSNSIPSDHQFTEKLLIKRLKLRPYKTKCRCEKIWNCTKMQMSIARCPADTFMCCG
jgi:hypothetical protein